MLDSENGTFRIVKSVYLVLAIIFYRMQRFLRQRLLATKATQMGKRIMAF